MVAQSNRNVCVRKVEGVRNHFRRPFQHFDREKTEKNKWNKLVSSTVKKPTLLIITNLIRISFSWMKLFVGESLAAPAIRWQNYRKEKMMEEDGCRYQCGHGRGKSILNHHHHNRFGWAQPPAVDGQWHSKRRQVLTS